MTNPKTIETYLALPYTVEVLRNRDGFFARVRELPGCMTWTEQIEDLWPLVEDAKRAWIEDALEDGDPVPEPARPASDPGGRVSLRVPLDLQRSVERKAAERGLSIDEFVAEALARVVGAA